MGLLLEIYHPTPPVGFDEGVFVCFTVSDFQLDTSALPNIHYGQKYADT